MLRAVVLTRHPPFPPRGGASLRNWQNINLLAASGTVAVLSVAPKAVATTEHPSLSCWRHVDSNAAGRLPRLAQRIHTRLWALRPQGHPNVVYVRRAAQELARLLRQTSANLLVFEELWLYPYINALRGWAGKTVYDAHNVEARLRSEIDLSRASIKGRVRHKLLSHRVSETEGRLVTAVDQVWTCSERDSATLRELYGSEIDIHAISNSIDPRPYQALARSARSEKHPAGGAPLTLVYPAAFGYEPNQVAAEILIRQVLPRVRASRPNTRLVLVGRAPPRWMHEAAAEVSYIDVTGEVPEIKPYLAAADVVVVPLLHGGGTRLKILEAFAARRPVVSTDKGAEGLDVEHGKHLLIANTPDEMAEAVVRLSSNPTLAASLADAAYQLLVNRYSWNAVSDTMAAALAQLNLPHR